MRVSEVMYQTVEHYKLIYLTNKNSELILYRHAVIALSNSGHFSHFPIMALHNSAWNFT